MGLWRSIKRWILPLETDRVHTRIVLEDADFRDLVCGREVVHPGVRIILSEIGWQRMLEHIGAAMRGEKEDHGLPK